MIEISIVPYKFRYLDGLHINFDIPKIGKHLPKVGFIALSGKTPVAMGFIRRVEPCFYMIDHLSATGFLGGIVADKALKAIVAELSHGIDPKAILAVMTTDKATMVRAQRLGVFNESVCEIRSRKD